MESTKVMKLFGSQDVKTCIDCGIDYVIGKDHNGLQLFMCGNCYHEKIWKDVTPYEHLEIENSKLRVRTQILEEAIINLIHQNMVTDQGAIKTLHHLFDWAGR